MSTTLPLIELRTGAPADLSIVGTLMGEAFEPKYGEAWTTGQCLGMLTLPGVWLLLASLNGEPAGFALTRAIGDEAELLLLAVRASARRRGVGASLLRAVIRDAQSRGVVKVHLEVRAGNRAVTLYEQQGFVKVGVRPDYYRGANGDVFDAHTFSLGLN